MFLLGLVFQNAWCHHEASASSSFITSLPPSDAPLAQTPAPKGQFSFFRSAQLCVQVLVAQVPIGMDTHCNGVLTAFSHSKLKKLEVACLPARLRQQSQQHSRGRQYHILPSLLGPCATCTVQAQRTLKTQTGHNFFMYILKRRWCAPLGCPEPLSSSASASSFHLCKLPRSILYRDQQSPIKGWGENKQTERRKQSVFTKRPLAQPPSRNTNSPQGTPGDRQTEGKTSLFSPKGFLKSTKSTDASRCKAGLTQQEFQGQGPHLMPLL